MLSSHLTLKDTCDADTVCCQEFGTGSHPRQKLIQLNEALEQVISEQSRELQQTRSQFESNNSELQQFAYIVSHDLQAPLRAISGFAKFLKEEYQDQLDENAHSYIERIVHGAERMKQQIDGLLNFSRVISRAEPSIPIDLNKSFDDAKTILGELIESGQAEITCDPLPVVSGDRTQLSKLFQNLIENSIRFSGGSTPQIHISANQCGEEWKISVRDNGIGIAENHHEKIFDIFSRLSAQSGSEDGIGIGLAICQRIVHRHGGRIWVTSSLEKGSTFFFTLPELKQVSTD